MLNIIIEGFRCHCTYKLSINDGLTLIRGSSGIGKSSIFEAVYWCLYGSLRNIYHPLYPNRRCRVEISTDIISVIRGSKPTMLNVSYSGRVITSVEEANSVIQYVFGSKDIWLSSSYLMQGCKNNWIELTTDEKLSCIESIAYNDCNPDTYYTKALQYKSRCSNDYDKLEMEYKIQERIYQDKGHYDENKCIDNMLDIQNKINALIMKEKEYKSKFKKHTESKNKIEQCNTMLTSNRLELDSLEVLLTKEEIDDMERQYLEYQNIVQYNKNALDINKRRNECYASYKMLDPEGLVERYNGQLPTLQELVKNEMEWKRYNEWEKNIRSIPDHIPHINIKDYEKKLHLIDVHNMNENYKKQILSLGHIEQTDDIGYKMGIIKDKISRYKSGKKFVCPTCKSDLEFNGNELVSCTLEHVSIQELESEYRKLHTIYEKQKTKQILESKILDVGDINPNEYMTLQKDIADHKRFLSFGVISIPQVRYEFTSQMLSQYNNYKSCNEVVLKQVPEIKFDRAILDKSRHILSKREHITHNISAIMKEIEYNKCQLDNTLEDTIGQLESEIKELTVKYTDALHHNAQKQQYLTLMGHYNKLSELYTSKYYIELILTCLSQTEYTLINDTVDLFNRTLEEVVSSLFDEPMTLRIELVKVNKQNKSKAAIHLQITYKGMEITNINQLSGGESTRISIALLIAFQVIHPTPFILIDESLSNVNHHLREQCCESIKKYCHVPCLMILHETSSEGLFDDIIELA